MSVLRPLYNRVIIKRDEVEKVSEGGIVLTDGDQPDLGTVIAVGPGKDLEDGTTRPMSVKEGDRVVIPDGAGLQVDVDGESLTVLFEEDIVGVIS